jgi:phosphoribosyl-AMP cyclohydrolase
MPACAGMTVKMSDSGVLENTRAFTPCFDAAGLIPAIVQDAADGTVLMFAWMNQEALAATRKTGLAHFYSRSRARQWLKGETSGETFAVQEMRIDCDQDVLLLKVKSNGKGNACHTGRRSCFYRKVEGDGLHFE